MKKSYNDFCPGHGFKDDPPENIIILPGKYEIEAEALRQGGALIEKSEHLAYLPALETQDAIRKIIDEIEEIKKFKKIVVLEASGPYSILAALVPPSLFYRLLAKEKNAVHAALEKTGAALARYLCEAQNRGADIISIADPYANREILGESRFNEFSAGYIKKVLAALSLSARKSLVHTCPYLELSEGGECIHSLMYENTSFSYHDSR